jgi:hypothetical protein
MHTVQGESVGPDECHFILAKGPFVRVSHAPTQMASFARPVLYVAVSGFISNFLAVKAGPLMRFRLIRADNNVIGFTSGDRQGNHHLLG